ncbi:hypothetical protein OXPF_06000 [Oxobacter pfennigii]|uniref:Phage protein n=2 Tax=Oxobacter pfennigii TaxID=36849 RepID=A0A0P9AKD8_9CLOT|nr:hypothetical protein OXPF_06000 [Oxobacter pfennigii]
MGVITINIIWDGINEVLNHNFPEVPIVEEISPELEKPYFLIKLLQGWQAQELGRRYRRTYSFDIHYFAVNNRESHSMAEQLYGIMGLIEIDGAKYRGMNMSHEVIDGVLHFNVDYSFDLKQEIQEYPLMQTMEQEGYVRG